MGDRPLRPETGETVETPSKQTHKKTHNETNNGVSTPFDPSHHRIAERMLIIALRRTFHPIKHIFFCLQAWYANVIAPLAPL